MPPIAVPIAKKKAMASAARFQREDFADRQVGGAGGRRGEEEDYAPKRRLLGGGDGIVREEQARGSQQEGRERIRAGDHRAPADRVEEAAQDDRPEEVPHSERQQVEPGVRPRDMVKLGQDERVSEEDGVVEEGLGDHQRQPEYSAGAVAGEHGACDQAEAVSLLRPDAEAGA